MLDCLIIGDSIAVGTKQFRPECADYAQGGITSHGWNKKFGNKDLTANTVIISLGTNDWAKADTYGMLMNIGLRLKVTQECFGLNQIENQSLKRYNMFVELQSNSVTQYCPLLVGKKIRSILAGQAIKN